MQLTFRGKRHAEKYGSSNFIAKRLVQDFLQSVQRLVERTGAKELHEVGCGEGHVTSALHLAGYRIRGTDISSDSIEQARMEAFQNGVTIDFKVKNIYSMDENDARECILCLEVLEHLSDPRAAICKLKELARPYLIVSVPREPLWRLLNVARGKYVVDLGNTPGHINHWSRRTFRAFIKSEFVIVAEETPIPWTILLCRPKTA